MELNIKQTIAVLVVVILAVSCLIPIINETVRQHDADPLTVPIGAHAVDDLDGWTMDVRKASTGFRVSSSMYDGTVTRTGVILSSSAVSVWTDTSRIYTMIGGTVTAGTTLSAIVEDGVMTVNDTPAVLGGIVYVPDEFGALGSYAGQTHGLPMAGIGSYAGVTVGSIADELTGNSSDYVLDVSVTEDGDRYALGYVPGEYEAPVQVPPSQQAQVKPGLDLDVIEDPEIFEREEFETVEKGEITIVPGKGDIFGDVDMEDVIVTPGKLPNGIQAVGDTTSGTTGQCTWELDGTVLYISGTGYTAAYESTSVLPWGTGITELVVGEGVTMLNNYLFYQCTRLSSVSLPSTLKTIGAHCFDRCYSLAHIDLPSGLTKLTYSAFQNCTNLKELICPESLTSLGQNVLWGCTALTAIYFPASVTEFTPQYSPRFVLIDGTRNGVTPAAGLFLREPDGYYYQTVEDTIDGADYSVNWYGVTLTSAGNTAEVLVPYQVDYMEGSYTVKRIGDGAVSGSSVRNVVIPQTVESISPTAITGPGIKEILNLSATEVTASHGEVRTSVPALAVIAEPVTAKEFGATASMLWIIPLMLVAGAVISIVRGFARARYD